MRSLESAGQSSSAPLALLGLICLILCLSLGGVGNAHAQGQEEVYQAGQASVIGNWVTESGTNYLGNSIFGSFQNFQGVATLNQASGALNNQANLLAISMGSSGGLQLNGGAFASQVRDNTLSLAAGASSNYCAFIGGQSFQNSIGLAMVNQVSGNMNVQVSQVGIVLGGGMTALSPQQLNAIYANNKVIIPSGAAMNGTVKLDSGAFQNFNGIGVVSQVAGNLNQVFTSVNIYH